MSKSCKTADNQSFQGYIFWLYVVNHCSGSPVFDPSPQFEGLWPTETYDTLWKGLIHTDRHVKA